jgi:hypothetical protein
VLPAPTPPPPTEPVAAGSVGFGGGVSSYGSTSVPLTITDSLITNNTTGAGGRGGNGTGTTAGGAGGSGGFGGGVNLTSGTALRLTRSTITGNHTAGGSQGGSGGPNGGGGGDGGGGGSGAGVFVSTRQGQPLSPVITETTITSNQTGRGGDAGLPGPGGYTGWAGYGGRGGGLSVFYDTLTLEGGTISGNTASESGAGWLPSSPNGGGIYTLSGHVTLTNGAAVSGNNPNNCYSVADVPGCVNDQPAASTQRIQRTQESTVQHHQANALNTAEQLASTVRANK